MNRDGTRHTQPICRDAMLPVPMFQFFLSAYCQGVENFGSAPPVSQASCLPCLYRGHPCLPCRIAGILPALSGFGLIARGHSRHIVQAVRGSASVMSVAFFCRRKLASVRRNHLLRCAHSVWQNLSCLSHVPTGLRLW